MVARDVVRWLAPAILESEPSLSEREEYNGAENAEEGRRVWRALGLRGWQCSRWPFSAAWRQRSRILFTPSPQSMDLGAMTPMPTGSTIAARSWEVWAITYMASCIREAASP